MTEGKVNTQQLREAIETIGRVTEQIGDYDWAADDAEAAAATKLQCVYIQGALIELSVHLNKGLAALLAGVRASRSRDALGRL